MRTRRGNLVILASVLCILIFMALGSLSYLSSTDAGTTAHLVRELQATALAESIAVTVEARVNSGPWIKRFWLEEALAAATQPEAGVTPLVAFSRESGHFPSVGEGLAPLDWGYAGIVKDVSSSSRIYRIYVEVLLAGERYTFSWDKRYEESLMGAMNRDATVMDKRIEETPAAATDPNDQLIDVIKQKSKEPAPDSVEDKYKDVLGKLEGDEEAVRGATTVATEPDGIPPLAEQPVQPKPKGKKGGRR
jgi:hypothetical protein